MILVVANLSLAAAQFAEPILFGRIIDLLTRAKVESRAPGWGELLNLLMAWVLTLPCAIMLSATLYWVFLNIF